MTQPTKRERGIDFEPFLGRLVVEACVDEIEAYTRQQYGLKEDSPIVLSTAHITQFHVPLTRGIVKVISKNSFGERFEKWFGKDIAEEGKQIQVGDTVIFLPHQSFTSDPHQKYHVISDEHIVGYIKASTPIKDSSEVEND